MQHYYETFSDKVLAYRLRTYSGCSPVLLLQIYEGKYKIRVGWENVSLKFKKILTSLFYEQLKYAIPFQDGGCRRSQVFALINKNGYPLFPYSIRFQQLMRHVWRTNKLLGERTQGNDKKSRVDRDSNLWRSLRHNPLAEGHYFTLC